MARSARSSGFTLVELLVVMAIIATLLTLAVPRYFSAVGKAEDAVLRENLATMRDAIDKYHGDTGRYPDSIDELVARRYLRQAPMDPVTGRPDTWVIVPPPTPGVGGVYDVKSGAPGAGRDGTPYGEW